MVHGTWYKVNSDFAQSINNLTRNLYETSKENEIALPPVKKAEKEGDYNYRAAIENRENFLLMDQRTVRPTGENRDPVEMCDLIEIATKAFIHIKAGTESSKLSHLFSQGYVAAELLTKDSLYRQRLKDKFVRAELIETIRNHCKSIFKNISKDFKKYLSDSSNKRQAITKSQKINFLKNKYADYFSRKNINTSEKALKDEHKKEVFKNKSEDDFLLGFFEKKFIELFTTASNESCKLDHRSGRDEQVINNLMKDCKDILGKQFNNNLEEEWRKDCESFQEVFSKVLPQDFTPNGYRILFAIILDEKKLDVLKVLPFFSRVTLMKHAQNIEKIGYEVGLQLISPPSTLPIFSQPPLEKFFS